MRLRTEPHEGQRDQNCRRLDVASPAGCSPSPASADDAAGFSRASGGKVTLSMCDITDEKSVQSWALGLTDTLGEAGLDVLISNAGILTPGPIEILPLPAIRREFEVNVFGAISVINAFLPALRKARGRIVQISTWTASLPLPFNGPSGASKAAMEVFATVYRSELKQFGIEVVVAAAGNMKTGGPEKTAAALARVASGMTPEQRELYGHAFESFTTALNGMQNSGLDSASAASRVIDLAEQVPAPIRATVGQDSEEILNLVREKSDAELDALRLRLGVGERRPPAGVADALTRMGYRRVGTVTEVAEFSVRGGILDVYGFGMAVPARLVVKRRSVVPALPTPGRWQLAQLACR